MDARFFLSVAAFLVLVALLLFRSWREQQLTHIMAHLSIRLEEGGRTPVPAPEGLPRSVSRALPTVTFSHSTFPGNHDPACVICLADFESKDVLRQLPQCHHAFHVDCIDQWFDKHSTCPICRVSLLPTPLAPLPPEPRLPALPSPVPGPESSIANPSDTSRGETGCAAPETLGTAGHAAANLRAPSATDEVGLRSEEARGSVPFDSQEASDGSSITLSVRPDVRPMASGIAGQTIAEKERSGPSVAIDVQ